MPEREYFCSVLVVVLLPLSLALLPFFGSAPAPAPVSLAASLPLSPPSFLAHTQPPPRRRRRRLLSQPTRRPRFPEHFQPLSHSPLKSSPCFHRSHCRVGLLRLLPKRKAARVSECAAAAARDPSTKAAGAASSAATKESDRDGEEAEAEAGFPLLSSFHCMVPSLDAGSTAQFQWKAVGGQAGRGREGPGFLTPFQSP